MLWATVRSMFHNCLHNFLLKPCWLSHRARVWFRPWVGQKAEGGMEEELTAMQTVQAPQQLNHPKHQRAMQHWFLSTAP